MKKKYSINNHIMNNMIIINNTIVSNIYFYFY